mmetsp:Transcript_65493/g.143649  ORF Transcript_65493/g.143649 Transcript_65493/m.143649 type:complete len:236 (+) Transcript_65493:129-836(+)
MILYRDSASSRKLCSMPKWALTLAHWTAPVKDTAPGRKSSILEEEILRLDSAVNDTFEMEVADHKRRLAHRFSFCANVLTRSKPKRGTSTSMQNHPPAKKKYWEKKRATTGGKKNSPRYSGGGRNAAAPPALAHGSGPRRTPAAGILQRAPPRRWPPSGRSSRQSHPPRPTEGSPSGGKEEPLCHGQVPKSVAHDLVQRLRIVPEALLHAQVGIDACPLDSTSEGHSPGTKVFHP